MTAPIEIHFDHGTLVLTGTAPVLDELVTLDGRTGRYRAPAQRYRDVVLALRGAGVSYEDRARKFAPLGVSGEVAIDPYPHQAEALAAWQKAGSRGIVELPTGAGKTILAVLAIARTDRPTLIVVPTIDLLNQWATVLETHLGQTVGMLGGGESDRQPITVTTYDSAAFQTEFHGDRFGLLICDECHHLPAPAYRFIASGSIAPYRLGLTATLARTDGGEKTCEALLGDLCYSLPIDALEGEYLAPYDIERVDVELTEEEHARYESERALYIAFYRKSGASFSRRDGWAQFIMRESRSKEGRRALAAYREQRRIAFSSKGKLDALWQIIVRHREERILSIGNNKTLSGPYRHLGKHEVDTAGNRRTGKLGRGHQPPP